MTAPARPPLPRLAFRVGVVGHRWDRLPRSQAGAVRAALAGVLARVRTAVASHHPGGAYDPSRPPLLRLVTALAEGADRLGAAAALEDQDTPGQAPWQLDVVLPFAETAYRATFSDPDDAAEFDRLSARAAATLVMDGVPGRFDEFVAGGRAVVDHCDLLLAVWDQAPARGAGGTANQVAYAIREEVPVVVVDPASPEVPWLYDPARPADGRAAGLGGLEAVLAAQLQPPAGPDLRATYFAELPRAGFLGKAFRVTIEVNQRGVPPVLGWPLALARLARALLTPDFPGPFDTASRDQWLARWADPPTLGAARQQELVDRFARPFSWADRLASHYGHRYRSAFAVVFGLSWIAVLLAFVGTLTHGEGAAVIALATVEFGILLTISLVVFRGRRGRFHERWLDYRALAERLRHLTFLWPVARTGFLARRARRAWDAGPGGDWTGWLVGAVVREAGMPSGTLDAAALDQARRFLQQHELAGQVAYHHATATRLGAIEHRFHPQVEAAFAAALLAVAVHLGAILPWEAVGLARPVYPGWLVTALAFATIVLPAFGAARHGFLGQADVLGSSLRSAALAARLEEMSRRLDQLGAPGELESLPTGDLALEAARIMEGDLAGWRTVFRGKPLAHA